MPPNKKYDKVTETFYAIILEKQQKCNNRTLKNEFHPKKSWTAGAFLEYFSLL